MYWHWLAPTDTSLSFFLPSPPPTPLIPLLPPSLPPSLSSLPPPPPSIRVLANAPGEAKQSFLNEINMMKKVAHGNSYNVVRMVGCVSIQSPYALVLEYVPYGSLLDYLRENRKLVSAFAVLLTSVPPLTANTSVGRPLQYHKVTTFTFVHLHQWQKKLSETRHYNCARTYICYMLHTYATCSIHMLHVTYICYMLHTYATCYIRMLHVAYICYMLHTYATCSIHMLHVAYICYM